MAGVIWSLVLLGSLVLFSCSSGVGETTSEEKKIPVSVIPARQEVNRRLLNALGTVEPNRELKLSFKIGGRIRGLAFEEGQLIRKGELLAELDPTELLARKRKALENRRKAKRDLDRMEQLYRKAVVPLSSYQDAQSALVNSEAELKIVDENLDSSVLRAPFTGRMTQKLSEVGEVVAPGKTIAVLAEIDPVLVKAAVPDSLIQRVKTGQRAHIRVDSSPRERFEGVVTRLETSADPLSRTFTVEVRLGNPGEVLRPGLIARMEVMDDSKGFGIFIPLDAVLDFGSSPTVFIVRDGTAIRRTIRMGDVAGQEVEILEGLIPDELVVISGQEYLDDKQPVLIDRRLEN
ncbi:MAG: efflux RND transporter periplasmic adaptor subunit [Proteobacteria bacterium]|nr:efflux RND transporter periplasmic adaptor subunit [Pseudomonadota bacterium]NIS68100.1 efflux RND transporter periplasmic adaptor subunit [Pseudomonadota bacterium]